MSALEHNSCFSDKKQLRELKDSVTTKLELSKARDNNDKLCKDDDLLDTHIRAILTQRDTTAEALIHELRNPRILYLYRQHLFSTS